MTVAVVHIPRYGKIGVVPIDFSSGLWYIDRFEFAKIGPPVTIGDCLVLDNDKNLIGYSLLWPHT